VASFSSIFLSLTPYRNTTITKVLEMLGMVFQTWETAGSRSTVISPALLHGMEVGLVARLRVSTLKVGRELAAHSSQENMDSRGSFMSHDRVVPMRATGK
jgi:hypothetical protein